MLLISCFFYILIAGQVFASGRGVVNESSKLRYIVSDSEIIDLDLQEDQQDTGDRLTDEVYYISDTENIYTDSADIESDNPTNTDVLNRDIVKVFGIGGLIGVLSGYMILRWVM